MALYRTEGPFLHSISLCTNLDRVQAGKSFVVEVSGNLAGHTNQATGQLLLYFTQVLGNTTLPFAQRLTPVL